MLKKLTLALVLGVLLCSSAWAEDLVSPSVAKEVAQELMHRNVAYYSAHPERPRNIPEWKEARVGDPILVHNYPDLKACYYIVPVINLKDKIICLIGTSAESKQWQWFSKVQLERFPKVSESQAYQICRQRHQNAGVSQPRVVEMPDKKLYWLCLVNDDDLKEIFVNIDNASEVHTNLDPDISDLTTSVGPSRIHRRSTESMLNDPQIMNTSYPESYNIENVPFYYQETSWYCCEATLEMIFDYWGPDISQDDIGDVANEGPDHGTWIDDITRASHFSYISTAIQNPMLNGYDERDLGYSSCEVYWSDSEHYPDRFDDLKNLISHDYPVLVATWYSSSHSSGHCRIVKGYDDWLGHFLVHDPWYSSPYSGPDVHFNQSFFVDDLWVYSERWGLFSAPWKAELSVPRVVSAGQIFTVDASFDYTAYHPFEGQFSAMGVSATISLPPNFLPVDPGSPTVEFGTQYSGFAGDTSWQIMPLPGGPGPDTIRLEVKGHITGSSTSYPNYEDWIGGEAEAVTQVVPYVCGDANGDDEVSSSDVVYLLNYLYREGSPPSPLEAGDVNLDSAVDGGDVVYLVNYLFRNGPVPCA